MSTVAAFHVSLLAAVLVALPSVRAQGADLTDDERAALGTVVDAWQRPGAPGGVALVWRDGRVVFEAARGLADLERGVPLAIDSVFDIASTSKQFTAASILLLAEDGALRLDQTLHEVLPEFRAFDPDVRIEHLVAHQSGLADYLWLMGLCGHDDTSMYALDDVLTRLVRLEHTTFEPGTRFSYSNTNYLLMACVVERLSNESLRTFATRRIFEPLGMTSTHFHDDVSRVVPRRALGYTKDGDVYVHSVTPLELVGDGAVLTCAHDLFRWSQHFRASERADELAGARVWSADVTERQLAPFPFADGRPGDYAFGLDVRRIAAGRIVSHSGAFAGYRSELLHCPEAGFGAVVLFNSDEFDPTGAARALVRAVGADLAPIASDEAASPATVDEFELPRFAREARGVWLASDGVPLVFTRDGRTLVSSGLGGTQRFAAPTADADQLLEIGGTARLVPRDDGRLDLVQGDVTHTLRRAADFDGSAEAWDAVLGAWHVSELDCTWVFERRAGEAAGFDTRFPNDEVLRCQVLGQDLLRGPFSMTMWRDGDGWRCWSNEIGALRLERPR
jgi:CubicO group peptidase (beta-lactamase class C family)